MKIVEELISARTKRGQENGDRLPGRHDPFAVELEALELDRGTIGVSDPQFDRGVSADGKAGRLEAAVAKLDFLNAVIRGGTWRTSQNDSQRKNHRRRLED